MRMAYILGGAGRGCQSTMVLPRLLLARCVMFEDCRRGGVDRCLDSLTYTHISCTWEKVIVPWSSDPIILPMQTFLHPVNPQVNYFVFPLSK